MHQQLQCAIAAFSNIELIPKLLNLLPGRWGHFEMYSRESRTCVGTHWIRFSFLCQIYVCAFYFVLHNNHSKNMKFDLWFYLNIMDWILHSLLRYFHRCINANVQQILPLWSFKLFTCTVQCFCHSSSCKGHPYNSAACVPGLLCYTALVLSNNLPTEGTVCSPCSGLCLIKCTVIINAKISFSLQTS